MIPRMYRIGAQTLLQRLSTSQVGLIINLLVTSFT